MLIPTPSLKEFIEPVPVCQEIPDLDAVYEITNACESDRVVVVDQKSQPIGLLNLGCVMLKLRRNIDRDPIQACIQPLAIVPGDAEASYFWSLVQDEQHSGKTQQWAVVDNQGKFLGLLDIQLLLKYLASQAESPQTPVYSSLPLLEQLPLPLMLQTSSGEVISQNSAWREQIGFSSRLDLPKQQAVGEFATLSLEPLNVSSTEAANRGLNGIKTINNGWGERNHFQSRDVTGATDTSTPTALKNRDAFAYCEAPIEKSAQTANVLSEHQRIWQFIKIPFQNAVQSASGCLETSERLADKDLASNSNNLHSTEVDQWLVLAIDITEQQQVAQELAGKNADLIQLNRVKDEFLACITHELKTPLTTVLGLSSLLKDRIVGELNQRQEHYVQMIHQSGRQLMTVVNDIIDLARIETGQLELMLEPVNIEAICEIAYSQAKQLHPLKEPLESESEFTLSIEPDLDMLVADELRLRQMLVHLLSNALKFTDTGSPIGLKVSRWEGWIAFTVWDTGIGIPPEKQHLIFQKFQQLENPMIRRFEGTGLGLVLTQHLARLHGGDVSFTSKVDRGSQFTLLLPPVPPQTPADSDLTSINNVCYRNLSRLVLIVEALPDSIEYLSQELNGFGYRVAIARSGTEAIEKSRRLQPCAILLNPLLPRLSGWDVLKLLKSDEQTRHIPILVTATRAEKEQAEEHQADGFLSVPVEPFALRESLIRLTKQKTGDTSSNSDRNASRKPMMLLYLTPEESASYPEDENLVLKTALDYLPTSGLNYRVLEADDLEQAELLARVWNPDVVLLDSAGLSDRLSYLKHLSQCSAVASIPLVTLDRQTTEAANQVKGLSVFPCLAPLQSNDVASLWQVIEVAAGFCCSPQVLILDLVAFNKRSMSSGETLSEKSYSTTSYHEWLQALIQYLQVAGFKSLLSDSWDTVECQLQHNSVDLLVIYLEDIQPNIQIVKYLASLVEQPLLPPVLLLDRRNQEAAIGEEAAYLEQVLHKVCTRSVKLHSQSMADLLNLINQAITGERSHLVSASE